VLKKLIIEQEVSQGKQSALAEYRPFQVILPKEAGLLPYIVSYLGDVYQRGRPHEERTTRRRKTGFGELIGDFFARGEEFVRILYDDDASLKVRVSAGVLAMGLEGKPDAKIMKDTMDLIVKENYLEILPAAFAVLSDGIRLQDGPSENFVNEALGLARSNLEVRTALEPMLAEWREITRSPVMSSKDKSIWH
jgi:hypothetical protein